MVTSDPLFVNIYNPGLLTNLEQQFGPFQHHHVDLFASTEVMLTMMQKMNRKKPRRGEVVMVLPNEHGQIWVHTKNFYPEGVYRLMTGGIEPDETPAQAMLREVKEETGFKTKIDRCLAVITYAVSDHNITFPFVSYVFTTSPTSGSPHPNDPSEAITNFKAVPVDTLAIVARKLRSLSGAFADWGVFRAIAHEVTQEQLQLT